jgi:putative membrane protein
VMDDQQVAGLIMWIPGNMVYFAGLMVIFGRWFKSQE